MSSGWRMAVLSAALTVACGGSDADDALLVSAAVSLREALVDIGRAYEAEGRGRVTFNFGSSNSLARQIVDGGPVDVFVSADEAQMRAAEAQGAVLPETRVVLLSNRLVVIVPTERPRRLASPRDLCGPDFERIALGDPDAVPAGVYAKAYLESVGLWTALEPRVVPVTSVRAALGAVENGGADAAFVYRTDALVSSRVAVAFEVPPGQGPTITYPAAIVRATTRRTRAQGFLDYLGAPTSRALFERHGFTVLERP